MAIQYSTLWFRAYDYRTCLNYVGRCTPENAFTFFEDTDIIAVCTIPERITEGLSFQES